MRSLIPVLLALACPIGMCVVPMLLMRRRGHAANASASPTEAQELRDEVARLRAERDRSEEPASR